jgi:hypothetical protein
MLNQKVGVEKHQEPGSKQIKALDRDGRIENRQFDRAIAQQLLMRGGGNNQSDIHHQGQKPDGGFPQPGGIGTQLAQQIFGNQRMDIQILRSILLRHCVHVGSEGEEWIGR